MLEEKGREELLKEVKNLANGLHICLDALRLIACPVRPDGTYNNDRESCRVMALKAINKSEELIYNQQHEIVTTTNI